MNSSLCTIKLLLTEWDSFGYFKLIQIQPYRDDVKDMNKMIMYAKVVTIRDKQLAQKKQIHHHYVEEEKQKDLMIEIDRLKAIKATQEREREHKIKQRQDHDMII